MLAHQLVWFAFFIAVAHYELVERLMSPQAALKPEVSKDSDPVDDRLWKQIILILDDHEKWRDPNLSMSTLSELLESNQT